MVVDHVNVPEVWVPLIDAGVHHADSNVAGVGNLRPEPIRRLEAPTADSAVGPWVHPRASEPAPAPRSQSPWTRSCV